MKQWKVSAEKSSPKLTNHLIKGIVIAFGLSIALFAIGVIIVLWMVETGLID